MRNEIESSRQNDGGVAPLSPAPENHLEALRALITERGEREALRVVGLSRNAAHRALARMPIRNGTRSLLREAFDHAVQR